MKLAAVCGARSAVRRWPCSNSKRCNKLLNLHVQGKTTFISPTFQTQTRQQTRAFLTSEGGGRQQSFTQSAPNEPKRGEGGYSGESWPSAGGETETGKED